MEGPPVSAFTAASPPAVHEAITTWATANKVTAARQLAYVFDDNEAFAAAVGLQPTDTADLWQAFVGHSQAWAQFRLEESLSSQIPWPSFVPRPDRPLAAFQPASAGKIKPIKRPNAASEAKPPCGSDQAVATVKPWTADAKVINSLWALMIQLGPQGAFYADLEAHSACMASFRDLWSKRFDDMDAKGMRQRWGHWKAWLRWCRVSNPPQQPIPVLAGLFGAWLQNKALGGPTAAPSALLGVCWVAKHTGLPLPDSGLLQPWRKAPLSHTPTQAVAYPVRVLAHFDVLSRSANPYIAHVASACRLRCGSGLRPEHVQRSVLLRNTDSMALGVCRLGKPRVDGHRMGFPWICPRTSIALGTVDSFPDSLLAPSLEFTNIVQASWLVWEWGPRNTDITEASQWLPRACTRLAEAERQLLQLRPLCMTPAQAARFECRSARRSLASAAHRFGLKDKEIAALGHWRGALPSDNQSRAQAASAICRSMAVRYDQGRLLASARAGQMVSEGLRLSVREAGHWNLEWDDIDKVAPTREALKLSLIHI